MILLSGWALLLAILSACAGQLLLRSAAVSGSYRWGFAAACCYVVSVLAGFFAAQAFGIGMVYLASASTYALVPLMAAVFLHESPSRRQLLGGCLIIVGLVLHGW